MDWIGKRVVFHGAVQGVGFRRRTEQMANDCGVVGYVRNLPDGSVEVVAEGTQAVVDAFIRRLKQTLAAHIDRTDEGDITPARYDAFRIQRY